MRTALNRYGPIAAYAAVILVNYLSNALPLNGQTQSDIAARYPSPFTPAGFTFSIWGLIYLLLLGYLVYQVRPARASDRILGRVSWLFMASCAANVSWLVVWHYDLLWLSLLIMLAILAALVAIYRTLGETRADAGLTEKLLLHLPFSIYLGWITVATIANISIIQTGMGWDDASLSAVDWTLLKLALAATIAGVMVLRQGNIAFGLVVAWAAFGISSKQAAIPAISGAATAIMFLALMLAAFQAARPLRSRR
ncbi:MAG: tryptophan-rich sensory protein [Xanthomonadales bacterium]|nr:tryptophan-rich sensory protein [Xanthomonadales bacterium]